MLDTGVYPRGRYDIVRRMRTLRRGSERLSTDFDWKPYEQHGYFHWMLPVLSSIVEGPFAREEVQARVAQILIDAARNLVARRPLEQSKAKVVAIVSLPDMFGSEVCVFFDQTYLANFMCREVGEEIWRRTRESLVDRWKLDLGDGFREVGFSYVRRDEDFEPPMVETGHVWMIGEL